MSVENDLNAHDRGYLTDTLHQTLGVLREHQEIDPGGECKRMIENLIPRLH